MKQNYKKMTENIHVPAGLNGRVLFAAMQTEKPHSFLKELLSESLYAETLTEHSEQLRIIGL